MSTVKQVRVKQRSALARFLKASEGLNMARESLTRDEWNGDFGQSYFKTLEEIEKILGPKVLQELRYLAERSKR